MSTNMDKKNWEQSYELQPENTPCFYQYTNYIYILKFTAKQYIFNVGYFGRFLCKYLHSLLSEI